MRKNPSYRKIILSDSIDSKSVNDTIRAILEVNKSDDECEEEYFDWEREPIELFINSFGGSVYDGLALYDIISTSVTPVTTIAIGSCMSMGFWVWLAGKHRLVSENATLMFHDISMLIDGKTEHVKQELEESKRLSEALVKKITSVSAITEKQLNGYIDKKAEWYIPSSLAVELRLADGIYNPIKEYKEEYTDIIY